MKNDDYMYIPLKDTEDYFYTYDFEFATTLVYMENNLVTVDAEPGGRMVFVFEKSSRIKDTFDLYWANKLTVDPLEYSNIRKNLKSRIHAIRKNY